MGKRLNLLSLKSKLLGSGLSGASTVTRTTTAEAVSPQRRVAEECAERPALKLSTSQRLWNAAYDSLEGDEGTTNIAQSYVMTLAKVLHEGWASDIPDSRDDISAKMKDPIKRQEYMKLLVDEGQRKAGASLKMMQPMGNVAEFILMAKGIVDVAIQNIPQAALPWAGICIGLQILVNPIKATSANLAGIAHVTSRMNWYCALSDHLLNKDNFTAGHDSFETIMKALEEAVIVLYKALLLYQMRSICSYYGNQGIAFCRDLLNLDDWAGDIEAVKKAEADVEGMSAQYHREYATSSLSRLVRSALDMEKQLSGIHLALRDFISQQKQMQMDDELTKCLRDLHIVDPQDEMNTIQRNKDELLDDAFRWVLGTKEFTSFINWDNGNAALPQCQLLWIRGPAGTGKTMLLIGIIRELTNHSAILAPNVSYFFCQGTDNTRNSATAVLRSLLWMLVIQQPQLSSHLYAKYKYSGDSLFTGPDAYSALSGVFENMLKDPSLTRIYFIVDALDECNEDLNPFIQLIFNSISICNKVKWLVSGRPEIELSIPKIAMSLIELDAQSLEGPVNAYIDHKLSILKSKKGYTLNILADISEEIHHRAANIFLWVALVFQQLDRDRVYGWDAVETIKRMPTGLSELYDHMMIRIEKLNDRQYCKDVLVAATLAYRPLSFSELSVVTGLQTGDQLLTIIEECGSFLTIKEQVIYLLHQSARDYLDKNYELKLQQDGVGQGHLDVFERSVDAISKLQQNIYSLPDFGLRSKDAQTPHPDPLASMGYSCLSWADHFCDAYAKITAVDHETRISKKLWCFLENHVLRWLESLSLLGGLPDGLRSVRRLQQELQNAENIELISFLSDIEKFLISNGLIISQAPLQIYGSALLFSPNLSKIKEKQWKEKLSCIEDIQGMKLQDACLQALEGHSHWVTAIAFSPNGKTLASGSKDGTIWLWDATIGIHQQVFEGHSHYILGMSFSPDGKTLASGCHNGVVQLWDVAAGVKQRTLESHGEAVTAVAFSPDGKTLVSGSEDHIIRLWDIVQSKVRYKIQGYQPQVMAIAFSPDGKTLASGFDDNTIRLWDAVSGVYHQHTLESNCGWVRAITFSPDGKMLASGSYEEIRVWDIATETLRYTMKSTTGGFGATIFSPDSKMLVSGSSYGKLWLWEMATGALRHTLKGHSDSVIAVSFSLDGKILASGSVDRTIRLWDMETALEQPAFEGHVTEIDNIVFSADGKILASVSRKSIQLWDAATGLKKCALDGHSESVRTIAFSPDGKTLASGSSDGTIRLWNTATGMHQHTFEGDRRDFAAMNAAAMKATSNLLSRRTYCRDITNIAYSPDGRLIASGSAHETVRLWDVVTGTEQYALEGHTGWVGAVAFSADSRTLASGSHDETIRLWDTTTGIHQRTLKLHSGWPRSIAFSPDSKVLALGLGGNTITLWDVATDSPKNILYGDSVRSMSFSVDGQILKTNCGYIRTFPQSEALVPKNRQDQDHPLLFTDQWVTNDGRQLLWIPNDYRTGLVAVYGNIVVLGHTTGVTFLRFNL